MPPKQETEQLNSGTFEDYILNAANDERFEAYLSDIALAQSLALEELKTKTELFARPVHVGLENAKGAWRWSLMAMKKQPAAKNKDGMPSSKI